MTLREMAIGVIWGNMGMTREQHVNIVRRAREHYGNIMGTYIQGNAISWNMGM